MKTIKRNTVLIALDYNPTAQKVAEVGYSLAKAMDAECFLIHILASPIIYTSLNYDPIMGFSGFGSFDNYQLDSELLSKIALNYLDEVKNHLHDSNIKTIVKEGEFAQQIMEAAKINKADIIVMGTHSQQWLEKILVGSTTESIIEISKIPIVIVPTKKE
jgi:nucleotide-binding universal stress UspA family protein